MAVSIIFSLYLADAGLRRVSLIIAWLFVYIKQQTSFFRYHQVRLASLREVQSATGEELSALLPSVLDRAFKGEL